MKTQFSSLLNRQKETRALSNSKFAYLGRAAIRQHVQSEGQIV